MAPTLKDGDYVLMKKPGRLRPGLVYLVEHSDLGRIIKRLVKIEKGRAHLSGDNHLSTPEAVMGSVETHRLVGQAWLAIGKSGIRFIP